MDEGHQIALPSAGEIIGYLYSCPSPKCGFTKMSYIEDADEYQVLTSTGNITWPFRDQ